MKTVVQDLTFGGHNDSSRASIGLYNGRCPSSCVFVRIQMQSLPSLTLPPVFLRSHCYSSNKASLSRNLYAVAPSLVHTLSQEDNSILSVATSDSHIYSGSQNQNISVRPASFSCATIPRARADWVDLQVWDSRNYTLQTQLRGHTGSVLALEYASDKHWLFSSSGVYRVCSMMSANHRTAVPDQAIAPSASVPLPLPRPAPRSLT